jgi:hypothetical protein
MQWLWVIGGFALLYDLVPRDVTALPAHLEFGLSGSPSTRVSRNARRGLAHRLSSHRVLGVLVGYPIHARLFHRLRSRCSLLIFLSD